MGLSSWIDLGGMLCTVVKTEKNLRALIISLYGLYMLIIELLLFGSHGAYNSAVNRAGDAPPLISIMSDLSQEGNTHNNQAGR